MTRSPKEDVVLTRAQQQPSRCRVPGGAAPVPVGRTQVAYGAARHAPDPGITARAAQQGYTAATWTEEVAASCSFGGQLLSSHDRHVDAVDQGPAGIVRCKHQPPEGVCMVQQQQAGSRPAYHVRRVLHQGGCLVRQHQRRAAPTPGVHEQDASGLVHVVHDIVKGSTVRYRKAAPLACTGLPLPALAWGQGAGKVGEGDRVQHSPRDQVPHHQLAAVLALLKGGVAAAVVAGLHAWPNVS